MGPMPSHAAPMGMAPGALGHVSGPGAMESPRFGSSPGDYGGRHQQQQQQYMPRNEFRDQPYSYSPYGPPPPRFAPSFGPPPIGAGWPPQFVAGPFQPEMRDDNRWYRPVEIGEQQNGGQEGPSEPTSAPTAPTPPPPLPSLTMHITVAGREFEISRALLAKYPSLPFAATVADGGVAATLEDDPFLFEIVLGFIRTDKLFLPHGVKLATVLACADRLGVPVPEAALQTAVTGRRLRFTRTTAVTLHTNAPRNNAEFTLFPGDELTARRDAGDGTLLVRVHPLGGRDEGNWTAVDNLQHTVTCANAPVVVQFQGENTYREPLQFAVRFSLTLSHDAADEA